jgi:hypothetical protein
MELSLRFEDNDSAHNDLILHFADERHVCDSYYLALDQGLFPNIESAGKVRAVLCCLLAQWLAAVDGLQDGGKIWLPYDFSDQCTGWLQCAREGEQVEVSQGWSTLEGWGLNPSNLGDLTISPPGFKSTGSSIFTDIGSLRVAIHASLMA